MGDQKNGEVAEEESDELYFEDRLYLWLTAPLWPLFKLPFWAVCLVAIWNGIGVHAVWADWLQGLPAWLTVMLVGPVVYLTLFGALPTILYSWLVILLMPWHAPPLPAPPVRSIIRQRVGRLKTAMAHKKDRRAKEGGWIKAGYRGVPVGSDGFRRTRRVFFWIGAAKTPPRIRWTLRALPKFRRKSAD